MKIEFINNQPCVADRPLSEIVHLCHQESVEKALHILSNIKVDQDQLDQLLTYCAQLTCVSDKVTCPLCKRRTEIEGVHTLEDFIASHEQIIIGDGTVVLQGKGKGVRHIATFSELEKTWSGENYWFWARRALRKLRHGSRRTETTVKSYEHTDYKPSIILIEPQLADNIGMVARACANFGLEDLRLVKPRDGWPNEKARIAASGASYLIDETKSYGSFEESIADLHWICATTARQRDLRKPILTSEQAVEEMRQRIKSGQRCGILFGRERSGLQTDEVAKADAIVMIPVDNRFASLNLAQAVLILGYDWMRGSDTRSLGRVTTYEKALETGLYLGSHLPATKDQLIGFFKHLESELDRSGFFSAPQKRPTVINNLRSLFIRAAPTDQEVRTLRGIVATLSQGKGKRGPSSS